MSLEPVSAARSRSKDGDLRIRTGEKSPGDGFGQASLRSDWQFATDMLPMYGRRSGDCRMPRRVQQIMRLGACRRLLPAFNGQEALTGGLRRAQPFGRRRTR